jgi:hypothetical protein
VDQSFDALVREAASAACAIMPALAFVLLIEHTAIASRNRYDMQAAQSSRLPNRSAITKKTTLPVA